MWKATTVISRLAIQLTTPLKMDWELPVKICKQAEGEGQWRSGLACSLWLAVALAANARCDERAGPASRGCRCSNSLEHVCDHRAVPIPTPASHLLPRHIEQDNEDDADHYGYGHAKQRANPDCRRVEWMCLKGVRRVGASRALLIVQPESPAIHACPHRASSAATSSSPPAAAAPTPPPPPPGPPGTCGVKWDKGAPSSCRRCKGGTAGGQQRQQQTKNPGQQKTLLT